MISSLVVGSVDADHLAIVLYDRSYPDSMDYWDGNWVRSILRVRAGGFTAHVTAQLLTDEIHRFGEGLKFVEDNLVGAAAFRASRTGSPCRSHATRTGASTCPARCWTSPA